ncbi:MAG: hypothetical protein IJO79_03825 [Firmicutes bacterium]|nr:hypothetical protein [Bacillota bacterium]
MEKRKFTVIKGGKKPVRTSRRFVSAYATDTRLMGVVGIAIHWRIDSHEGPQDHYQLFYYDTDEYGLETYRSHAGAPGEELHVLEKTMFGGLGGAKVQLTEKEARFLLQKFAAENPKKKQVLPEPQGEYAFILQEPVHMTKEEQRLAFEKVCTPILSTQQLIHYFLMRLFGWDWEGAAFLASPEMELPKLVPGGKATFCKNTVEPYINEDGKTSYLCETLIETANRYHILVLELTVKDGLVTSLEKRSGFQVTPAEAAMQLNRPEFITVYEILAAPEEFDPRLAPLMVGTLQTAHEAGRLHIEFNPTNDHVNRKTFRLNEDIHALIYVSDFGQLILGAYSLDEIREAERKLKNSSLSSLLLATARFEFKEPILYEFINSGFDDFGEFLRSLQPQSPI